MWSPSLQYDFLRAAIIVVQPDNEVGTLNTFSNVDMREFWQGFALLRKCHLQYDTWVLRLYMSKLSIWAMHADPAFSYS